MLRLLDTDTCSYAIRGASTNLDTRLASSEANSLAISVVARAELMFGLAKRGNPRALSRLVHGFLDRIAVLRWDAAAADRHADLRVRLERDGTPIGMFDTMIAGHALALKAVLVTNNRKRFQKARALKLENWLG